MCVCVCVCVCVCLNAIIVVAWGTTKSDNSHDSQTSMPSGRDSNSEQIPKQIHTSEIHTCFMWLML